MSEPLPVNNFEPIPTTENEPEPKMTGRRGFLRLLIHGLGAIFAAIIGVPALLYLVDPRNRNAKGSDYEDLVHVDELPVGEAREFIVRRTMRDAWTLEPNMVVGRVFVIKRGEPTAENLKVDAYNVTCPHLGCAINYMRGDACPFQCPCHGARFDIDGKRIEPETNVAERDMYKLHVQPNPEDNRMVQLQFRSATQMKQQDGETA